MIGCGSNPEREQQDNGPPSSFLENTEIPPYNGVYFSDHYNYIESLWNTVDSCNIDKQSIKDYYKEKGSN